MVASMIKIKQILDTHHQTTAKGFTPSERTDLQVKFSAKPREYTPRIDGQFMGKRSKSDTLSVDAAQNFVLGPPVLLQTPTHSRLPHHVGLLSDRTGSSSQKGDWGGWELSPSKSCLWTKIKHLNHIAFFFFTDFLAGCCSSL